MNWAANYLVKQAFGQMVGGAMEGALTPGMGQRIEMQSSGVSPQPMTGAQNSESPLSGYHSLAGGRGGPGSMGGPGEVGGGWGDTAKSIGLDVLQYGVMNKMMGGGTPPATTAAGKGATQAGANVAGRGAAQAGARGTVQAGARGAARAGARGGMVAAGKSMLGRAASAANPLMWAYEGAKWLPNVLWNAQGGIGLRSANARRAKLGLKPVGSGMADTGKWDWSSPTDALWQGLE